LDSNNNQLQPTPYKFYWGGSANLKSIATIQVLCTLIVKCSVAPQQNLYATLAATQKNDTDNE